MGSLPFGQWVLITDARHQVSESRHPCPCFLCIGCHQVQRIHVVAMVNGETASGVEVPVSVPMEDITPSTFGNLVKRVNRDWEKEHSDQAMSESVHQYINTHLQAQSTLKWLTSWKANCNYNKCKIILSVRFARWLQGEGDVEMCRLQWRYQILSMKVNKYLDRHKPESYFLLPNFSLLCWRQYKCVMNLIAFPSHTHCRFLSVSLLYTSGRTSLSKSYPRLIRGSVITLHLFINLILEWHLKYHTSW